MFKYFVWGSKEKYTLDDFQIDLAWTLIDNNYLKRYCEIKKVNGPQRVRSRLTDHRLMAALWYAVY